MQPLPNAVGTYIASSQDALQVAAADVLDDALFDGALTQRIQRRKVPPGWAFRIARQGQQL
jgi:hypothetical protein